jgi:hypothetical protein
VSRSAALPGGPAVTVVPIVAVAGLPAVVGISFPKRLALSLRAPPVALEGMTTIVTVALAPAASPLRAHVTVPEASEQLP